MDGERECDFESDALNDGVLELEPVRDADTSIVTCGVNEPEDVNVGVDTGVSVGEGMRVSESVRGFDELAELVIDIVAEEDASCVAEGDAEKVRLAVPALERVFPVMDGVSESVYEVDSDLEAER